MPLAGPDSTMVIGFAFAAVTVAMPPFDCIMKALPPKPPAASRASSDSM